MKPPAKHEENTKGNAVKTVCLDCGCEFLQAEGNGRDRHECPICSGGPGADNAPTEPAWSSFLPPPPEEIELPDESPGELLEALRDLGFEIERDQAPKSE